MPRPYDILITVASDGDKQAQIFNLKARKKQIKKSTCNHLGECVILIKSPLRARARNTTAKHEILFLEN